MQVPLTLPISTKGRVIAYVDGYNLYHGLRSAGLRSGYWLDIPALVRRFLPNGYDLIVTKYFTSRVVPAPDDPGAVGSAQRQTEYLEAIQSLPGLTFISGQFHLNQRRCRACSAQWWLPNEKMTDVNIASEMLTDAFLGAVDVALLISADSDLSAPIKKIREHLPDRLVWVVFPPWRGSDTLKALAHQRFRIRRQVVLECQLPEEVVGTDGFPRRRPPEWNDPPRSSPAQSDAPPATPPSSAERPTSQ